MSSITTIPLTTIFTPPTGCNSHWTYEAEYYNSIPGGLLIQNDLPNHLDIACFPSGFSAAGRVPGAIQVYSPGACPAGYATVGGFSVAATTTAVCCPSGFSYSTTYSTMDFGSSSGTYEGCISMYSAASDPTTVLGRNAFTDLNTTTVSGPVTMWAQPIMVEFQKSDLSLFPTTTSASSSTLSASPSSTVTGSLATQTAMSPGLSEQNTASRSISSGAIAGIAIAAAIILGLLIGMAFFLRRRKVQSAISGRSVEQGALLKEEATPEAAWVRGELESTEVARIARPPISSYTNNTKSRNNNERLVELDGHTQGQPLELST